MGALIIAPIFEEILCRGILLEGLLLRNKPYISIVISASMFSLMHGNLVQIPNTFFMGLIIGWVYYKTRSVIPCIFAHFINNLLPTILYCNPKLYNDGKFNVITLIMGMIFFIGSVWGLKNGVE
ncbi:lysostaphin resistance A-like protein [Hathewaya massiliensis]|uniref:CPBP family intramembrane glutamic endopeptidase n=1 Tax=Hathewaya massiliensis TaxID=1964382 RepID=UPI003C12B930